MPSAGNLATSVKRTKSGTREIAIIFVFAPLHLHILTLIGLNKLRGLMNSFFTLDRQHRQELKATWSRLNRQSGGTVIPGGGPVMRNSVSRF